jgi:O-antigen/teichoic acid export membrane protein
MKATSIFGGVQFFTIIVAIVKSKFIAVLLGPAGMGIAGLLTSTTGLINGLTNFGLGTSAVKDVAAANATGDETRIATIVTVLQRWVWITGVLGALVTLIFAHWLSLLTFGNSDYTIAFVWLAVTLLFQQLTTGRLVVLQGLRKLSYLAKANISGSIIGLSISVPLYYFFGVGGIVPALMASSATAMLLAWYFARKVPIRSVKVTRFQTMEEGRGMLRMGFIISLTGLITLGVAYIVRIYINHRGGVADVGLYNAGFAIINTYVGLVFTAMGTDYYPRLSGVASDRKKTNQAINQQAEIAILILAPILIVFLVYINWVVILLYSTKFVGVSGLIHWAALGILFKAVSWSIAFVLLAKGASKLFFWNELLFNFYMLVLNLVAYRFWGLDGLGFSFLVGYILYMLQVFILTKLKYEFAFNLEFYRVFGIQLVLGVAAFVVIKSMVSPASYIFGTFLVILSTLYSLRELDRRIGLRETISSILLRFRAK